MLVASPIRTSSVARALSPSPAARAQLGIFLLAYLLYSAARFVTIGDLSVAQANADWIMDLQRDLGVSIEASVQQALTGTWALWVLNHLYLAAQLIVLPGALVFLYRRSRPMYERLRNTILATWVLSIPIYAAFPVAPPRLADSGLVDTISAQTGVALDSSLTTSFYNELAAVPSLHVGFAVAIGVAVAGVVRNPALRLLALLWGPAIGLAVVATGNHYVFDIAAGVVAAVLGYLLGAAVARMSPRRAVAPRPAFAEA
jgi:hypothetical protein